MALTEMFKSFLDKRINPEKQKQGGFDTDTVDDESVDGVVSASKKGRAVAIDGGGAPQGNAKDGAEKITLRDKNTEVALVDGKTAGGNFVGEDRVVGKVLLKKLMAGETLIAPKGHPVLETTDALIAKVYPHIPGIGAEKRAIAEKDRVDAMIAHGVKKFAGKPLRLDGNKKFMTMAIDSALAAGVAVEIPKKYQALLLEREGIKNQKAVVVEEKKVVVVKEKKVEGIITASKKLEPEQTRVTGRLTGYSADVDKDGARTLTIVRAGVDSTVKIDEKQFSVAQAKGLLNKPVRYEPPAKGKPARVVDTAIERSKSREKGTEIGLSLK